MAEELRARRLVTEAGERAAKAKAERATAGELAREAVNEEAMERTAAREEVEEVEAIMIRPRPVWTGGVRVEVQLEKWNECDAR